MIIKVADFKKHNIVIEKMTTENHLEHVTLDLHVGEAYRKPGDSNRNKMPDAMILSPNETYVIESREKFFVPNNVFGIVFPRSSFSAQGLAVANLKVDPNFQNSNLYITIFNTSKNRIKINKDEAICCVSFQFLESPVADNTPRIPPSSRLISENKYIEWFYRNFPFIITFVLSVIASIIASKICENLKN